MLPRWRYEVGKCQHQIGMTSGMIFMLTILNTDNWFCLILRSKRIKDKHPLAASKSAPKNELNIFLRLSKNETNNNFINKTCCKWPLLYRYQKRILNSNMISTNSGRCSWWSLSKTIALTCLIKLAIIQISDGLLCMIFINRFWLRFLCRIYCQSRDFPLFRSPWFVT